MLLLPIHPLALYLGKMLAGVVRGLLTSFSVMAIAILATGKILSFLHPLFLVLLILNCTVFAGFGVLVGLSVRSLESVGLYNNFFDCADVLSGRHFFLIPPWCRWLLRP